MGKTWTVGVRTLTAEKEQLEKVVAKLKDKNIWFIKLSDIQQKVIEKWKHLYFSKPVVSSYVCSKSLCPIDHKKFNFVKLNNTPEVPVPVAKPNLIKKEDTFFSRMTKVVDKLQHKYGLPSKSLSAVAVTKKQAVQTSRKVFKPRGHNVPLPHLFLPKIHVDTIDNHGLEEAEEIYPAQSNSAESHDVKAGKEFNTDAFDEGNEYQNAEEILDGDIAKQGCYSQQDLPIEAMDNYDDSEFLESGAEDMDDPQEGTDIAVEETEESTEVINDGHEMLDEETHSEVNHHGIDLDEGEDYDETEVIDDSGNIDEDVMNDEGDIIDGGEVMDDSTEVYEDESEVMDNNLEYDYDEMADYYYDDYEAMNYYEDYDDIDDYDIDFYD